MINLYPQLTNDKYQYQQSIDLIRADMEVKIKSTLFEITSIDGTHLEQITTRQIKTLLFGSKTDPCSTEYKQINQVPTRLQICHFRE